MGLNVMDSNEVNAFVHGHGRQSERAVQSVRCVVLARQVAHDAFA